MIDDTDSTTDPTDDDPGDTGPTDTDPSDADPDEVRRRTPGRGVTPAAEAIEPDAPDEFGLVYAWWGNGKGKTTAALGMGMRAVGHGFRVHLLQLMKGGADSVEAVRGEYNAISALPGFSYENLGHYGWQGMADGSDDAAHAEKARAGFERARELVDAAGEADLSSPKAPDGPPEDGVHMLIVDELLYAAERDLVDPADVVSLVEDKPDGLELVLTGGHSSPDYLVEHADLLSEVRKHRHPIDAGQRARRGTEY